MSIDLRLPNINAQRTPEQVAQIRSYLYQLTQELQWALNTIESGSSSNVYAVSRDGRATALSQDQQAINNFNEIKALIIKSADIVDAYYEEMEERFRGSYVAQSDFGVFSEETLQAIETNSTAIQQNFIDLQNLINEVATINEIMVNAYIRSGLLYYGDDGAPVYGLEIGQQNVVDGVETFNKFARFTADKLSFYDRNDTEVAYISDYKLVITHAEIRGSLTLGGYVLDTSDGLAFKWQGVN